MTLFVLFLCIVLSELASFSFSADTQVFCPDSICTLINDHICCGIDVVGHESVPSSVTVKAYEGEASAHKSEASVHEGDASASFQAGFPPCDPNNKKSVPICDHIFKWTAIGTELLQLKFTDDFALQDLKTGNLIQQELVRSVNPFNFGIFSTVETYTDTHCPKEKYDASPNPWCILKTKNTPNGAKEFKTLLGDSVKQSSNAGIDLVNPPTGLSGSEQVVPLVADNSVNTPVIPAISDSGNLLETPFSPVDSSAFKPNLNAVELTGDNCIGYDCEDLGIFKRGTPGEFRA